VCSTCNARVHFLKYIFAPPIRKQKNSTVAGVLRADPAWDASDCSARPRHTGGIALGRQLRVGQSRQFLVPRRRIESCSNRLTCCHPPGRRGSATSICWDWLFLQKHHLANNTRLVVRKSTRRPRPLAHSAELLQAANTTAIRHRRGCSAFDMGSE